MDMQRTTRQIFRAGMHMYLVMTIVGGLSILFGVWVAVADAGSWVPAAIAVVFYALLLGWTAAFRIEITETELVFRSPLGTRRIARADIQTVKLGIVMKGRAGFLRLVVQPKGPEAREISIDAKVFTEEAIRAVLALGNGVTTADADGDKSVWPR